MQHDPHKCKIKLEKFDFDILCRFGVIKESLLGGAESVPPPPPPGEIGLSDNQHKFYLPSLSTLKGGRGDFSAILYYF